MTKKGKKMDNQITCPHCKKTITNHPLIKYAATGKGIGAQSFNCDCGERITYWAITAQLKEQKTISWRFQNWVRTLSPSQG
jgi:hypothetical protein